MSGLAVAWGADRPRLVAEMLSRMEHREVEGIGGTLSVSSRAGDGELKLALDGWLLGAGRSHEPVDVVSSLLSTEGPSALGRMSGEYAIAVARGDELIVARDAYGVKPLYRAELPGCELFASEIKAFPDSAGNISALPAGSAYSTRDGLFQPEPQSASDQPLSEPVVSRMCERLRSLVFAAVKRRLPEGNIGLFLSGGLDSSVVASVLAEQARNRVMAFAVGVRGCPDLQRARQVADHLDLPLQVTELTADEVESLLPEVIYHLESFDSYLVRSSVANYVVARQAKAAGMSVAFCGEGADELFAGYSYLKGMSEQEARAELRRLMAGLPGNGLQRVDRMTGAHGLEARVPFLDRDLVRFAARVPMKYKIWGEERIEKYLLRRAFEWDLPAEVVWRSKDKFYEGSGSGDLMDELPFDHIALESPAGWQAEAGDLGLSSPEELFCYREFRRSFPRVEAGIVVRTRTVA